MSSAKQKRQFRSDFRSTSLFNSTQAHAILAQDYLNKKSMASRIIRRILNPASGPKAVGPYSKGVLVDRTLYLSGQLGLDPATMELCSGIEAQTKQAMENMGVLLKDANTSFSNVVKVTIYLSDMKDYPKVNDIYAKYFSGIYPARTCFQVAALPRNGLVEIDAIAVVGQIDDSKM